MALGWTCCRNAWWKTLQRHHVWSTVLWCLQMRGIATKIQGCSTLEPQESQHHLFIVGEPGPRPHTLEECHQERCEHCWEGAQGGNRGKEQKAPQQSSCPCCLTSQVCGIQCLSRTSLYSHFRMHCSNPTEWKESSSSYGMDTNDD